MKVLPIPCLLDNYAYLLTCEATGASVVVDVSEAAPVRAALEKAGVKRLEAIWATHHHADHVGGNEDLVRALLVPEVVGHVSDRDRIPGQTRFVEEGETLTLGELRARVLHIPGHTTGAVAYVVEGGGETCVFTGDTLFLAGCGRLFEGTPAMMHASLEKLKKLPKSTRVYCGHEYTQSNLKFAAHVEPSNRDVAARAARVAEARAAGKPTVPGTMEEELLTNPFLRVDVPELRATLGIPPTANGGEALGAVRQAKDGFR